MSLERQEDERAQVRNQLDVFPRLRVNLYIAHLGCLLFVHRE